MEYTSASWFSEMGMEDPSCFIHQCEMSSLDELTSQDLAHTLRDDFPQYHSISQESYNSYSCQNLDIPKKEKSNLLDVDTTSCPPTKVPKTNNRWSPHSGEQVMTIVPDTCSPSILSFGKQDSPEVGQVVDGFGVGEDQFGFSISKGSCPGRGGKRGRTASQPPASSQDHIIAERKRREKLSQRFIALSAIVPGLKKMDKASVLGDAIKYVKQLQDKVKTLEDKTTNRTVESVVLVKKSQVQADDDTSSIDESFEQSPLPEIEARVSDKTVLLRVHCEKRKGELVRILSEIESLNLTILNTSVLPFAGSVLDITIVAQMDEEFSTTVQDLVKNLSKALRSQFST